MGSQTQAEGCVEGRGEELLVPEVLSAEVDSNFKAGEGI